MEVWDQQTHAEEVANSLTHGVGLVLSAAGWAVLLVLATLFGDVWHITSSLIYGGTLVFLYGASTLYHSARTPRMKRALRVVDHVAIFLLIAGTYTPFTLVLLRDGWGWTILTLVWGLAVAGLLFKLFSRHRFHWSATIFYLLMGWVSVIFVEPMWSALPTGALVLLAAGGLAYTAGVIFYGWHSLRFSHAIWHGFVLLGSILHYLAIALYVLPA
ncbi:PAQR family membrane homeostasis protein TrhA [Salisaeta longa]|uniref:PAQR family membrane homeostasis protein TrhA n=1 Tax=Salisaeta longa TaxID=503170 RepID=UPI0003B5A5A1|nr:hemolysin III family protein [Salisaeta longa]